MLTSDANTYGVPPGGWLKSILQTLSLKLLAGEIWAEIKSTLTSRLGILAWYTLILFLIGQ